MLLVSLISLSCNQPFQPEIEYTPKLNVYAVLFSNSQSVYVRLTSVVKSPSDISQPVHGASVTLTGTGLNGTQQLVTLSDTASVIDGDTASYYYAPVHIIPNDTYTISAVKDGYPPATASVSIPSAYATIPDQNGYSVLQNPKNVQTDIQFDVNLSGLASAVFAQVIVEYRGLDAAGNFHSGSFNVIPIDSLNPFTEIESTNLYLSVDINLYQIEFKLAKQYADSLKVSHMYADIVVTQVDNNLYRYFITSTRTLNPLSMRTDKIVFTNIFDNAGTGVVGSAAIDTTRVFLF